MKTSRLALLTFATVALSAATTPLAMSSTSPPLPNSSALHARFVVLGQVPSGGPTLKGQPLPGDAVALARAVLEIGSTCPMVSVAGTNRPMGARQNPHLFPVVVCEAMVDMDSALSLVLADTTLPLPMVKSELTKADDESSADAAKIMVFGDTGCGPVKSGKLGGCPAGSPAVPFANLTALAAAGSSPDLILHMGDYNYRGTSVDVYFEADAGKPPQTKQKAYDAGDHLTKGENCGQAGEPFFSQNSALANFPDSWEAWRDDFFAAAGELLPKAPWIFARGNHELCSRAGPGWFYFLDPSSNLVPGGAQKSCPVPDKNAGALANVVLSEPYAVDLGALSILVVDSANACDAFTNTSFTEAYTQQFESLQKLAPPEGAAWMVSHRPLWGVTGFETDKGDPASTGCTTANAYGCINRTMQAALAGAAGGTLPESVDLVLAGHMHRFQALTFAADSGRPPMVIVGTGGVGLEDSGPAGVFATVVDGEATCATATTTTIVADGKASPAFGYLDIDYAPNGTWQGKLENPNLTWATCGTRELRAGSVCGFEKGVTALTSGVALPGCK